MNRFILILGLIIIVFLASLSLAGIPKMINYQGMLTDNSGNPLSGSYTIIFRIYNDPSAGTKKWEETQSGVSVTNGLFNVILGSVTPIDTLSFNQDYWLDITVGAEHMPSRLRFTSVGYAYRAQWADSADYARIGGGGSGSPWIFRITDGSDTTITTGGRWGIARYGNTLYGNADSTHVNLGVACTTGTSGGNLKYCTVGGGVRNTASISYATVGGGEGNTASGFHATVGGGWLNTSTGDCATVGGGYENTAVWSATVGGGAVNTASANAATVAGGYENTASNRYATVPGGYQDSAVGYCSLAAGYRAKALHSGSFVWADSTNVDFNSQGVNTFNIRATGGSYFTANDVTYGARFENNGTGDGLRAYANVSSGYNWGAIYAVNTGSSPSIYATNVGTGKAGYFDGAVEVVGYLYKTGGGFKIDHPLDPENKYLYHSFVESPDMKNIYDGVLVLDGNGEAWVELPEWFDMLNRDFRYQLTAIGAPGPNLYIAEKVADNHFKIAGGQSGMEVSWQVTGIRKDPYAEKHRIPVEEEKPANERGTYLHPDAYNLPETMGINYTDKKQKTK